MRRGDFDGPAQSHADSGSGQSLVYTHVAEAWGWLEGPYTPAV